VETKANPRLSRHYSGCEKAADSDAGSWLRKPVADQQQEERSRSPFLLLFLSSCYFIRQREESEPSSGLGTEEPELVSRFVGFDATT
jgi:hypothetical protein